MENQHRKIKGYRELTQHEIDLMNEGKELAEKCGCFIEKLELSETTNKEDAKRGETNLKQGFMWAIRSIARPEGF